MVSVPHMGVEEMGVSATPGFFEETASLLRFLLGPPEKGHKAPKGKKKPKNIGKAGFHETGRSTP